MRDARPAMARVSGSDLEISARATYARRRPASKWRTPSHRDSRYGRPPADGMARLPRMGRSGIEERERLARMEIRARRLIQAPDVGRRMEGGGADHSVPTESAVPKKRTLNDCETGVIA